MSIVRFVADDPAAAWAAGTLAEDLGWESPDVPVRVLRVLATGERLALTSPLERGLIEPAGAQYGPCPECGSTPVGLLVDDERLGDAGPVTLLCESCGAELQLPAEPRARTRIGVLRMIVRDRMAAHVDGYLVDIQTANLLVQVYNGISPAHRELFGAVPLAKLVDLGWRVAR